MSDLIDNGGYRFWKDDFSLQSAYEDCKGVFDGITDDDSFQECDTGLILYHAYEIMYALKKALLTAQPEQRWIPVSEKLPEPFADVIVTNGIGIYIGWIDPMDKGWRVDSESEYFMKDIIAWMPRPKPY